MATDPRVPVLVGVGTITQRAHDPGEALDEIELMVEASRRAADDAGSPDLLRSVAWIGVPDGTWGWPDPGVVLARHFGCEAHTVIAGVGVLQHALWWRACELIAAGDLDVALVVGGEAKYREQLLTRGGVEICYPSEGEPDERWSTDDVGIADIELARGLHQAASAYALMERSVGAAAHRDPGQHLRSVGALWAGFGQVAAGRDGAWDRSGPSAAEIITPTEANRTISTPYTRLLCSQWNVDQAGALILCSAEAASRHGVPQERWVFPTVMTENRATEPVAARPRLDRVTGARVAGRRALEHVGHHADEIDHLDLYSCFPSAVEIYATELGIGLDRQLTVTGGLTFGGGPFNNYVIQSTAEMARVLRADPGTTGLVTSVSGFVGKQGFDLWSTRPPAHGVVLDDVSTEVQSQLDSIELDPAYAGPATIVSSTVFHLRGDPWEAVTIVDTPEGARTVANSQDADVLAALGEGDWTGAPATVTPEGTVVV